MFSNKVGFILAFASCIFTACQQPQPKQEKGIGKQELTINIVTEPQSLDPGKVKNIEGITLMRMFFEGLTRINAEEEPELALAKRVEISEDLTTYTFYLRLSAWSNNDPVTADDFIYAWKRVLDSKFPGDQAFQLYPIKNAKAIKNGQMPLDELGVKALDSLTLQVELEEPTPYFLKLAALPIFFPVNGKVDQKNPNWAENSITYVSNGPFLMKKWEHQNLIEAKKNPTYWDASSVRLASMRLLMVGEENTEYQMFEKKELDWVGSPLSKFPLDAIPKMQKQNLLESKPLRGTFLIRINTGIAPFDVPAVRRALGLSINRKDILDNITSGTQLPATGLVPVSMGLQAKPYFNDNAVEEARECLIKAKVVFPEVTLMFPTGERSKLIAEAIQQQWKQAFDMDLKLEPVEHKVFYSRVARKDYQLAIGSLIADFDDPITFLDVFKYKGVGSNNTQWENSEYIELLDKAKKAETSEARKELLTQAEQLLMKEMPIIPIFHYNMLYMKNEHVQEVAISSMGCMDFKWAYIK